VDKNKLTSQSEVITDSESLTVPTRDKKVTVLTFAMKGVAIANTLLMLESTITLSSASQFLIGVWL
jgi:hypothetical protein